MAEQQLRSASFSGSAHSSSVTATASPSSAHLSAATALSTPPLIATSVRPAAGAWSDAAPARRASERPGECVRGELGGVELAGAEAAELGGDLAGPDPRRVEHRGARARA